MIQSIGRNKWRVDVHARRGAPRRRAIVEGTRRAAEDEERRLEDEVRGKLPDSRAAGKITISDIVGLVVAEYKLNGRASIADAVQMCARWTSEYGHRPATALTHGDLITIATHWQAGGEGEKKLSNARINRLMSFLLRGYGLHQRNDRAFAKPFWAKLKGAPPRSGFLEYEDFYRLRAAMDPYLRPPATIANSTGMREGEVLEMEWTRVRFDHARRCVTLDLRSVDTKNDEARQIVMFGDLYNVLADWHRTTHRQHPTCIYVCHRDGKRIADTQSAWSRAAVAAGFGRYQHPDEKEPSRRGYTGILFHDLRRSGLRNLIRAGVPRSVAMKISGHKDAKVFERYNIVDPKDLEDAGLKVLAYEQEAEARRIANLAALADGGHLVDTTTPESHKKPRKSRKSPPI